jgi:hypothetical protein
MADQEQRPAFHAHSGWTFQRLPFGHVSVAPNSAAQAVSFTPETWASIVASLGKGGETNANWRAALAFHQDAHSHGEPTHIRAARLQVIAAVDAWEEARLACDKALINQHPGLAEGVAVMRAAVECYDAEERLLSLRAILAGPPCRTSISPATGGPPRSARTACWGTCPTRSWSTPLTRADQYVAAAAQTGINPARCW